MVSGIPYKQAKLPDHWDAIVIGSGIGGLTAAVLLALHGMRWAKRTTHDVLEAFTSNRELIGVLTAQWGDYGLPPAKSSFAVRRCTPNGLARPASHRFIVL